MKYKDAFKDNFQDIEAPKVQVRPVTIPQFIESRYVDKRTGAEYIVKEPTVSKPDGDFRVSSQEANERFNSLMGISRTAEMYDLSNGIPEVQFDTLEPEPFMNETLLQPAFRRRANEDLQRTIQFMPSTDVPKWASSELETNDDFTINENGQIKDKPFNTEGLYGTEKVRHMPKSKMPDNRADLVKEKPNFTAAYKHKTKPEVIEDRMAEPKMQIILSKLFHGLLAANMPGTLKSGPSENDRKLLQEPEKIARRILDAGLVKPWTRNTEKSLSDRIDKPEDVAYTVGRKAVEHMMNQRMVPEILDLSALEREELTVAIGRTILNSVLPSQRQTGGPTIESFDALGKKELQKIFSAIISPRVLNGFIKQGSLSEREQKEISSILTVSNPSNRVIEMPLQQRQALLDERKQYAPRVSKPTMGSLECLGRSKPMKKLFDMDIKEEDDLPEESNLVSRTLI